MAQQASSSAPVPAPAPAPASAPVPAPASAPASAQEPGIVTVTGTVVSETAPAPAPAQEPGIVTGTVVSGHCNEEWTTLSDKTQDDLNEAIKKDFPLFTRLAKNIKYKLEITGVPLNERAEFLRLWRIYYYIFHMKFPSQNVTPESTILQMIECAKEKARLARIAYDKGELTDTIQNILFRKWDETQQSISPEDITNKAENSAYWVNLICGMRHGESKIIDSNLIPTTVTGGAKALQPSYRLYNKVRSSFNNNNKSNVNIYKTFKRFKNNKSSQHKSKKQRGKFYKYNNNRTKNKKYHSLFNKSLKRKKTCI
jgi:hypothetical protein